MLALKKCHFDIACHLIDAGCNLNKPDRDGNYPLDAAIFWNYPELIGYMRKNGAKISKSYKSNIGFKSTYSNINFENDLGCHTRSGLFIFSHHIKRHEVKKFRNANKFTLTCDNLIQAVEIFMASNYPNNIDEQEKANSIFDRFNKLIEHQIVEWRKLCDKYRNTSNLIATQLDDINLPNDVINNNTHEQQARIISITSPQQVIAQEKLTENKIYLMSANFQQPINLQKQEALSHLFAVIEEAKTLYTIYDLLIEIKQAQTSRLRLYRKSLLSTYGDTDSYGLAIKSLAEKALIFKPACNSFFQYVQLHTILAEALRCNAPGHRWKELLIEFKNAALGQFLNEISQETDLTQLLALFQALIVPANLLRFKAATFQAYGDTDTYKTALLQLGQQVVNNCTFTKQALYQLYLLLEHLRKVKPRFNAKWQRTIEKLEDRLQKAHVDINFAEQPKNLLLSRPAIQ